jgi:anthranilate phosphoribosyltransferase
MGKREPMALDFTALADEIDFLRAPEAPAGRLEMPRDRPRPVLLPSYYGARTQPNLTALVALLLRRYGVPVLVHGPQAVKVGSETTPAQAGKAAPGATHTADVLWELGIEPAGSRADVRERLLHDGIAYAPIEVLAPGFAQRVAMREEALGRSLLPALAALLDPFGGDGFRVIGAAGEEDLAAIRAWLIATRGDALLFRGAEGEPFADPRRQPRLEHVVSGAASVCVEAEGSTKEPSLPSALDAPSIAAWITQAMAGSVPLPPPIVAELGCCLNGARRLTAAA